MGNKIDAGTERLIQEQYEATDRTIASIMEEFGVSRSWFNDHRRKGGWVRKSQPVLDTTVTSNAASNDEMRQAIEEAAEALTNPPPQDEASLLAQRVAELEAELAEFRPTEVEWIIDEKTAAEQLADQMAVMIENEMEEINIARAKRNLPAAGPDILGKDWEQKTRTRLVKEAVAALTASSTNEGTATRTVAWLKPNGTTRVKIPYDGSINNFSVSPTAYEEKLKEKGFKKLSPALCWRQDCWLIGRPEWQGYCGELHRSLDPFIDAPKTKATVTESFKI